MCGNMVGIQFPTAEKRRGKRRKKERKKETNKQTNKQTKKNVITGRKYNDLLYYIGQL